MHKLPSAAVFATAATLAAPAVAGTPTYEATLNAKQEVPKSTSKATGTFSFTMSKGKLKFTLTAKGLSGKAQAAHIHEGARGKAGGIIVDLATKPFSSPRKGTVSVSAAARKAIRAGNAYVNIHTADHPAGEIRGQIKKG